MRAAAGLKQGKPWGLFPGTIRLDETFDESALLEAVNGGFSILHVATHFDLRPGNDTDSHLLLGTGDRLSLRELRERALDLRHLDMLTLSACNTAMGGAGAQGAEIEGMGTIVQRQGARAVIANLWSVADRSTGLLMQTFYALRSDNPQMTKSEALQQAQLSLLQGEAFDPGALAKRGLVLDHPLPHERVVSDRSYSHPYYWAPFILMGNWL